jgi:hypothetical protein
VEQVIVAAASVAAGRGLSGIVPDVAWCCAAAEITLANSIHESLGLR